MLYPLYTLGYTGVTSAIFENAIRNFVDSQGGHAGKLIDTRLNPYSRNAYYIGSALKRTFQEHYIRMGDSFGNLNYKQPEKGVQLAKPEDVSILIDMLKLAPQIIMCSCKDHESCHRSHVAHLVEQAHPTKATIIHLTLTQIVQWSDRTKPALQPVPEVIAPPVPKAIQQTLF